MFTRKIISPLLLLLLLLAGSALAQDDPTSIRHANAGSQATLRSQAPAKSVLPVERMDHVTFEKAAERRAKLEANTGFEISYTLVQIHVRGDVMHVDPFRFNR